MKIEDKYKKETGLNAYKLTLLDRKLYSDKYVEWLQNQLLLHSVIQQRELLIDFHEFLQANYCHHLFDSEKIKVIEEFEETNCI